MVFKSKVKEELFHELRQFIFWYHYNLSKISVADAVGFVFLNNRTLLRYKQTKNHYISVDLANRYRAILFNLGFSFSSLKGLDYVTIDYKDKDGLGSTGTFVLEDSEGIVEFLIQMIKFIPSDSYLKHYLTVFKSDIRNWLVKSTESR